MTAKPLTLDDIWSEYSDQQLTDVIAGFDAGEIKLVTVANRAALPADAANWLNDCEKVMVGALRTELCAAAAI